MNEGLSYGSVVTRVSLLGTIACLLRLTRIIIPLTPVSSAHRQISYQREWPRDTLRKLWFLPQASPSPENQWTHKIKGTPEEHRTESRHPECGVKSCFRGEWQTD